MGAYKLLGFAAGYAIVNKVLGNTLMAKRRKKKKKRR